MICLYCHQYMEIEWSILSIFQPQEVICEICYKELTHKLNHKRCAHCHHKMSEIESECLDCKFISSYFQPVNKIMYCLDYNDKVKMLFHRYKFLHDAAMSKVLSKLVNIHAQDYDCIVPVPISTKRMTERGYNQTTLVLDLLSIQYSDILVTNKQFRQSELSKSERLKVNSFKFKADFNRMELCNKKVLIVDDIYTTGITVHQVAQILYQAQVSCVDVLAFSKS